jgi:PAS domain S-box-containing protein
MTRQPFRFHICTKLNLFTVAVMALLTVVAYCFVIPRVEREKRDERKDKLRAVVDTAVSLMAHYEDAIRTYRWKTDPSLPRTREEAQARVLAYLQPLRYEKDEHLFILDGAAHMIFHPLKPDLQGRDMSGARSPDGSQPFREMAFEAQRRESVFINHIWLSKWSQTVSEPQITFARYFYPWDWVVCSSLYTQDIDDAVRTLTRGAALSLGLGALLAWGILSLVALLITRPLVALAGQVRDVAGRADMAADLVTVRANDEIGDLADAFRQTLEDLRQAAAQLRWNEENLRITLDSIGDGVIATDTGGRITRINPVAAALCGWSQAEAQGRDLAEVFRIINAGTRDSVPNPVDKVLTSGQIVGLANHTALISRDGREYQIADSAAPIRGQDGLIRGVVLVFRDVTHEYELEDRLRQREKMDAIGQLAGGIAHDFNNQLGGVLGYADMLVQRLDDPTLKQYASGICTAATRAADLTQQLLAFGRKGKYLNVPTDLHKTIAEVVELLRRSIDKRIAIKQRLEANPATVLGDPTQLQNAILNLALNARDAMPQGGELIFATRITMFAEASLAEELAPGPHLQISVTDSGMGMSAETQRRLFEPFYTTKEVGKGTGLGLASVYGTVKNHHGAIRVYSELGKGSTFNIYLPLLAEVAGNENSSSEPGAALKGHGRILIVDDESVILAVGCEMLREFGYEPIPCADPVEALEIYRQEWQNIDLVILDMVMPKLGGRDLFLAMKGVHPDIRAILASGYSLNGEAQGILDSGMLAFVQKPFNVDDLVRKVANALPKNV